MGEQAAERIEALVDSRKERTVSLRAVFGYGSQPGVGKHAHQSKQACSGKLRHATQSLLPIMPRVVHDDGDQQRHNGVDDDSGAGLHQHRADRVDDDEVTQPFGIDAVATSHQPHEGQQYAEQVHADIAGFREQELRTAAAPHRTIGDVLAVHEMREIVDERLEPQMDGEPLHDAHGEGAPVGRDKQPDRHVPGDAFDMEGDDKRAQRGEHTEEPGEAHERGVEMNAEAQPPGDGQDDAGDRQQEQGQILHGYDMQLPPVAQAVDGE